MEKFSSFEQKMRRKSAERRQTKGQKRCLPAQAIHLLGCKNCKFGIRTLAWLMLFPLHTRRLRNVKGIGNVDARLLL